MIIYGQVLGEKDCDFNVTKSSKNFLVYFFGFYNHYMAENFNKFITELNIHDIIKGYPENYDHFSLNGHNALEVYNVCDRRTFDVGMVLPTLFERAEDAIEWFNQKLKESDYMNSSDINDIVVIDADKLMLFLEKKLKYKNKESQIKSDFKKGMLELKQTLLKDFSDEESKEIIKNLFQRHLLKVK